MVPSQFGVVKKKDRELRSGTESRTPFNLYKLKCDFVENSLRANKAPFGASHLRTQKTPNPYTWIFQLFKIYAFCLVLLMKRQKFCTVGRSRYNSLLGVTSTGGVARPIQ